MSTRYALPAGFALTVTPDTGKPVVVSCAELTDVGGYVTAARTFGPYMLPTNFTVTGDGFAITSSVSTVANLGGLLLANAGAPVTAVQASANVNPTGDDNGLTFTAREYGTGGNAITVTYTDPGANSQSLAVSVAGKAIFVSLATNESGTITSTAAEVKAAIDAHEPANRLVTVAIMTADTGAGDDGSGVVTAMASTALESGAGTGIGTALPGALCIDTTNSDVYRNDGTTAAPVWVQLGDAA